MWLNAVLMFEFVYDSDGSAGSVLNHHRSGGSCPAGRTGRVVPAWMLMHRSRGVAAVALSFSGGSQPQSGVVER